MGHAVTQKYQFSMPLYQQEQEWKSIGIDLSRKSAEERQEDCLRLAKDKLEAFFVCLEEIKPKTVPKSAMGNSQLFHRPQEVVVQCFTERNNCRL